LESLSKVDLLEELPQFGFPELNFEEKLEVKET